MDNKSFKEEQLKRIKLIDDVFKLIKEKEVKNVDFRFTDLSGEWRQFTIPVGQLERDTFFEGFTIDGSLICNWKLKRDSDLTIIPDPSTARIDTVLEPTTVFIICDIYDPIDKKPFKYDPRSVAKKSIEYISHLNIADKVFIGAESKFFIFESSEDYLDNLLEKKDFISKIQTEYDKHGYLLTPPEDKYYEIRNIIVEKLLKNEIEVERHHCESAFVGQNEISFKYSSLVESADVFMIFKNIVKNVANFFNKTATFTSKPIFENLDNTLHIHLSLWKDNKNIFIGDKYGGLSELALNFIGGILHHTPSLLAFTNPSFDSYFRLKSNKKSSVSLTYSKSDRCSAIRIPTTTNTKRKRVEFRIPDADSNPYLTFSAVLMAGIDGIIKNINPGEPIEIQEQLTAKESAMETPENLEEALENLENDNDYLKVGEVFSDDLIKHWIKFRLKKV
ncbi:MAG: glutamine synthetase family protein [Ignavibacteria bacterium]|nr:glutamine synthetase family protein [Ignavibacteria bacterium]